MILTWRGVEAGAHGVGSPALGVGIQPNEGAIMIWETPVAIDLRFGMEITMYADHR